MNNKGFTLIELLVSVAIFSLVVAAASSLFSAAAKAQRRSLENQKVLDNGRYVLETISKAIRMSEIQTSDGSLLPSLEIDHATKGTVTYALSSGQVTENGTAISSANVTVDKLYFTVSGVGTSPPDDVKQPKVTIILKVKSKDAVAPMYRVEVYFQTTISQRNLDTT